MNKVRQIRKKGLDDYYFFCKQILGYDRMMPEPHRDLCESIQHTDRRKNLILMPRGTFKSSVVTVGHCLWTLAHNPNNRILIAHGLQKLAKKYLMEVRGHIESNAKLKALYGDWSGGRTWRDDEFVLSNRTRIMKEPSVMAGSLEKGVTVGMHFDTIYLDDPVTTENCKTAEQVEKTIEYYKLILSVLEPDGKLFICGTRWHTSDLYGWILDESNNERKDFQVTIRKALDEEGNPTMPKILSKEFLTDVRKTQGEVIFAHQYLNTATMASLQTFDASDIRYYDSPPTGLLYFITIDCAISLGKRADYTGIIVNGVDYDHNYFIHEAIKDRMTPSQIIDKIFELHDKYSPIMCLGIETNALDQSIKNMLMEEMGKRDKFIPISDVKIDPKIKKEDRIRWLQVKLKNHKLFLKKEHEELASEIKLHPQTKHDDLLDALKSQIKITFASDVRPQHADKNKRLTPVERAEWENVQKTTKRSVRKKQWKYRKGLGTW